MNKSQNLVKTDYWNIKRSQSRQEKTQCTSNSNIYWEHNTDVVAFACLQLKCHLLRCEVDCIFFYVAGAEGERENCDWEEKAAGTWRKYIKKQKYINNISIALLHLRSLL